MDIFLYFFFRVAQLPGGFFGTPLDSRGRLMPTNMQCIYYELRLRAICATLDKEQMLSLQVYS